MITTLDGIIAGMQPPVEIMKTGVAMEAIGTPFSHFYSAGMPGPAVACAAGIAGEALISYPGQLPFNNPVSGNSYLARLQLNSSVAAGFQIADRLWHNSGINVTSLVAQPVGSVPFPARDRVGSANGAGVMVAVEVTSSVATGNTGAVTVTMNYKNQDNVDKVATAVLPATAQPYTFIPFQLAAGDTGVRSIVDITLSASVVSGSICLVAYRVLTSADIMIAGTGVSADALQAGFVRLYDNTVPFIIQIPTAVTATVVRGQLIVTQG